MSKKAAAPAHPVPDDLLLKAAEDIAITLTNIWLELTRIGDSLERAHPKPPEEEGSADLITQSDEEFALMDALEKASGRGEPDRVIGFGAELLEKYHKTMEEKN